MISILEALDMEEPHTHFWSTPLLFSLCKPIEVSERRRWCSRHLLKRFLDVLQHPITEEDYSIILLLLSPYVVEFPALYNRGFSLTCFFSFSIWDYNVLNFMNHAFEFFFLNMKLMLLWICEINVDILSWFSFISLELVI